MTISKQRIEAALNQSEISKKSIQAAATIYDFAVEVSTLRILLERWVEAGRRASWVCRLHKFENIEVLLDQLEKDTTEVLK